MCPFAHLTLERAVGCWMFYAYMLHHAESRLAVQTHPTVRFRRVCGRPRGVLNRIRQKTSSVFSDADALTYVVCPLPLLLRAIN